MLDQPFLQTDHVVDSDNGKIRAPGLVWPLAMRGARAGCSHAAAQHIGADNKIFVGIYRRTGANQIIPPTGAAGFRVWRGNILVACQSVADQQRIALVGIERAVCLVRNCYVLECTATIQRYPLREGNALVLKVGLAWRLIHFAQCICADLGKDAMPGA